MSDDEQVVFLYDDTVGGSAKSGFILTSKYLYNKSDGKKAAKQNIGNIAKISQLTASKLRYAITIEMVTGGNTDFITAVFKEKRTAMVHILDETISLMKNY